MSVTNRAGHTARTGRDDSHAQNSSGTTCDGCDERDAEGIDADGRSLCRPCARRARTLIADGGSQSSLADLSAFQRDVLWTLARDGASKGLAVKDSLEDYYAENVNHGRLYQNLDKLVDRGLITKGERDRRTNEYQLTDAGRAALADRLDWQDTEEVQR